MRILILALFVASTASGASKKEADQLEKIAELQRQIALLQASTDKATVASIAATVASSASKAATVRHAENIQELKKGTTAAEEAAEHAKLSAQWSKENHEALIAAVKQIGKSASDVNDLKKIEVQNGHTMTLLACAIALALALIVLLFYLRGRSHGR